MIIHEQKKKIEGKKSKIKVYIKKYTVCNVTGGGQYILAEHL